MRIVLKNGSFTSRFLREFSELTNYAKVFPRDLNFNINTKTLTLPLIRFPICKESIFGHKHDNSKPIKSILTIREIQQFKSEIKPGCTDSEVTLMFGVTLKGNKMICSSAEEPPFFAFEGKLNEIDIALNDIEI